MGDETLRVDLAEASGSSLVGHVQSGIGAQARTVQSKLRDLLDVMDYVSEGSHAGVLAGTVDASGAISSAIAEALARGRYGVRLPAGRFLLNDEINVTVLGQAGFAIEGEGLGLTQIIVNTSSGDAFDIVLGTEGTGNWWLNVTPSNTFKMSGMSICASLHNVGTAVKVSGGQLTGRPPGAVTFDHVEWRARSSIDQQAFLIGLHLYACGSVQLQSCRFLVGGLTNNVPTAVKIETETARETGSIWFNSCQFIYGGLGVHVGSLVEGIYFNQCSFVRCKTAVHWVSATPESGFHMTNGHLNTLETSIVLENVSDWTMIGVLIFGTEAANLPCVSVDGGNGFAFVGNVVTGRSTVGTTGIRIVDCAGGSTRGGYIGSNAFSNLAVGVSVNSGSSDVRVGDNQYNGCATRVSVSGSENSVLPRTWMVNQTVTFVGGAASETFDIMIPVGNFVGRPDVMLVNSEASSADYLMTPMWSQSTATMMRVRVVRTDGTNIAPGALARFHAMALKN